MLPTGAQQPRGASTFFGFSSRSALRGPQEPGEERPVHQQYPAGQVSAPAASSLALPRASQGQAQPANAQHLREYNRRRRRGGTQSYGCVAVGDGCWL